MSLEFNEVSKLNDISQELRDKLTEKVKSFGKRVRYKFDIAKPDPYPEHRSKGMVVYPKLYTLDPCVFNVIDKLETRKGVSKSKRIGLIASINEKGGVERFKKIRVRDDQEGYLSLNLEEGTDDFYMAMILELHPKLKGGDFADSTKNQVVTRIDETAYANKQRAERSAKLKASRVAEGMTHKDLVNFADAMQWDSTEDELILRNKVEALAETDPPFFNDLVEGKNVEYQATVKQALDKNIITFDPAEYKFSWSGNKQTIALLSPVGEKNHIEKLSEWLQVGDKGNEIYVKIKGLMK